MKFGQKGLDAYKAQNSRTTPADTPEGGDNTALKALNREDSRVTLRNGDVKPGLLKTGGESPGTQEGDKLKGTARAARFLLLLGKDEAGKVLRAMSEAEIEQITAEIARINSVSTAEAGQILDEFGYNIQAHSVTGGISMARDILFRAFGQEKGRQYISRAVPDAVPQPFSFMNDLTLPQMLQIVKGETPESLSVILSFMEAEKVSSYLQTLPPEEQVLLVKRMARMQKIHPEVLNRMEGLLHERVHNIARMEEVEIDGKARLTEILRHMGMDEEKNILRDLEDKNPDLSREIRDNLLTMDCIFQLRPRDLQNLLLETSDETLVLLLKDKEERVVEHILSHLSSRRRMLLEEARITAPLVPRKDVQLLTGEFLERIRRRQEEGSYILLSEEDEYLI